MSSICQILYSDNLIELDTPLPFFMNLIKFQGHSGIKKSKCNWRLSSLDEFLFICDFYINGHDHDYKAFVKLLREKIYTSPALTTKKKKKKKKKKTFTTDIS